LRIGVAKARPALRLSRKRVKICLPTCFCLADLGSVGMVIRDSRSQSWQETTQIIVATRWDRQRSIPTVDTLRYSITFRSLHESKE
jgi:hypothetical protein